MKLRSMHIAGFKSIAADPGQTVTLGDITVLLGANGSGKSNLLSFFAMLRALGEGKLDLYVGRYAVDRLLHYGKVHTNSISFQLDFDDGAQYQYQAELALRMPERLYFKMEKIGFGQHSPKKGVDFKPVYLVENGTRIIRDEYYLASDTRYESGLLEDKKSAGTNILHFLKKIRCYQFHDTSETARIKSRCYVDDASALHSDGGNLAAFLRMLKIVPKYEIYYQRIVRHIRSVMPQFGDFDLTPLPENNDYVRLNWRDRFGSAYLFDPHQLSDGTLRIMALTTLLLQPPELMPAFIVLDEPELGLHPSAVGAFAAMANLASEHCQLLMATQSTRLVDEFEADDLVIAVHDASQHSSVFDRRTSKQLKSWLKRYCLSELWEKNVLGDQP